MTPEQRTKQELQAIFDRGDITFRKLTKGDKPYKFTCWADDEHGQHCLYYQFEAGGDEQPDHKKRVPLHELYMALRECASGTPLSRNRFKQICTVAQSAGPCGFAVAGRCLEKLGVARFDEVEREFVIIDKRRAQELLD